MTDTMQNYFENEVVKRLARYETPNYALKKDKDGNYVKSETKQAWHFFKTGMLFYEQEVNRNTDCSPYLTYSTFCYERDVIR